MTLWESAAAPLQPKRTATPLERQAIAEVCDMATELADLDPHQRPGYLLAIKGTTSPRQRALAVAFTPPDAAAWPPLMAMLDALIATEPGVVTQHGWFDEATIRDHGGRPIIDANGEGFQFADASGNYRAPAERGPAIGRFSTATNVVPIRKPEWFEKEAETA